MDNNNRPFGLIEVMEQRSVDQLLLQLSEGTSRPIEVTGLQRIGSKVDRRDLV
jgi:hypothetical protein